MDESVIPVGYYCYDDNGACPYWSRDPNHHEMENGYCKFLEKGDWEMNIEKKWRITYQGGKKVTDGKLESAEELGMYMSVLWDQVKECNIKYGEVEDDNQKT